MVLLAGLVLLSGAARASTVTIDPGTAPQGTDLTNYFASDGVTLSTFNGTATDRVVSTQDFASNNVFGWQDFGVSGSTPSEFWWNGHTPDFQADLNFGAQSVSIDTDGNFDAATMSVFDASMALIGTTAVPGDPVFGSAFTLSYSSASDNIYRVQVSLSSRFAPDQATLTNLVLTTGSPSAVPEPGSLALLAMGGLPMAGLLRRRRR